MGFSKDQAERIFNKYANWISKTIKKKIAIYDPLEFEKTHEDFIKCLQDEDFKVLREMPKNYKTKVYLDVQIKSFLIQNTYYALEERYIKQRIMNKIGSSEPDEIRILEAVDFIMAELEKDDMSGLKKFKELCKFKYFLGTVVTRRWFDYLRRHYKIKKNVEKFSTDFENMFDAILEDPQKRLIKLEYEKAKKIAAEILPEIMDALEPGEKQAIKWKYEDGLNVSGISRGLGYTRYKTEKFIAKLEKNIAKKILDHLDSKGIVFEDKKEGKMRASIGGKHDTS
jgi:RNA polymerase sigma factor (sigma-70 family)